MQHNEWIEMMATREVPQILGRMKKNRPMTTQ